MAADSMEHTVERAISDYLAVSRARDTYASVDEYERAEARAWDVVSEALKSAGQGDAAEFFRALDRG